MNKRGWGIVGLNLLYMGVNFSALTLFSVLGDNVSSSFGLNESVIMWAAIAYSTGIFLAFFAGHSRMSEEHPALIVIAAASLAALPQFLIPELIYVPNWLREPALIALRLTQGLVMMAVPIFSKQVGKYFISARPLALGIILSGIFIGGFIGSSLGPALTSLIGWEETYLVFGILMISVAGLWKLLTPKESFITSTTRSVVTIANENKSKVWRTPFTIVWGLTFFPAIWVIFTLAPLINFIVEKYLHSAGQIASMSLEGSYLTWSILIGGITYLLAERTQKQPRDLFKVFASVQAISFIISTAGVAMLYVSRDITSIIISLILIGVVQGTAPTFWSMQSTAYPEESVTKAGYALGLIANSAALIGPISTLSVVKSTTALWELLIVIELFGCLVTLLSIKLRMPIEET